MEGVIPDRVNSLTQSFFGIYFLLIFTHKIVKLYSSQPKRYNAYVNGGG